MIGRAAVLLAFSGFLAAPAAETPARYAYPAAPRSDTVDDYHGTKVRDPYRRLEDSDTPESRAWIEAENSLTRSFLDAIPERAAIRARLLKLQNFERTLPPVKEGGRFFFSRNDGLQNQPVVYVLEKLGGTPRILLDPNVLSKDGTVAVRSRAASRDGRYFAYCTSTSGSDWQEWHVRDVDTGTDLPDLLKWTRSTRAAWTLDGKGFYYTRFPEPAKAGDLRAVAKNERVFFHELGKPQSEDALVLERPDEPELRFAPSVTDDGRYLVLTIWKGTDRRTRFYLRKVGSADAGFERLLDEFDAAWSFAGNVGTTFYFLTDLGAPRGRVVSIDVSRPGKPAFREVVPESGGTLLSARLIASRLVLGVNEDASEHVRIHRLDGTFEKEVAFPTLGSGGGFDGRSGDAEAFYSFQSFTHPPTIYRYDFTTGKSEVFRASRADFDPAAFEVERVSYPSKDGTKVPMFLVHKRGLARNGRNPTLLTGYGAFGLATLPSFSVRTLAWVEMGGVFAQACLRGGGEYGEEWHRAGMLDKKQNVFDDFAAAGEWLIANRFTSKKRLAIIGGSAGGLLVGATLNQHPELFGAAVSQAPLMDMLRFQKFTVGWGWTPEYGSPDDPAQFKWLYAYSPLHNIKNGAKYPAVLVTTADHDDRVVPAHAFKYTAALQAAQGGDAPILIRIETKAGHGGGTPTSKQIEETADVLAFLSRALGGLRPPPR